MKGIVTCVLALACAAPAFGQGATTADTERALIANERRVNEAVVKNDMSTFNSLVAHDGMVADMSGFSKVAEFTKHVGQAQISTWDIADPRVYWVDESTAIVMYTWTGKGTWAGQPIPEKAYASTVWTERNGRWIAVFHQETAAVEMPAEKK